MRRVGRGTLALGLALPFALGLGAGAALSFGDDGAKDLRVPDGWESAWSAGHVLEGQDVALVWGDAAGADPTLAPDALRFDPDPVLDRLDELYRLDVDELAVALEDGPAGAHKVVVVVDGTWTAGPGAPAATDNGTSGLAQVLRSADPAVQVTPAVGAVGTDGVGVVRLAPEHLRGDGWEVARGFAEVVQHFALLDRGTSGTGEYGATSPASAFWDASAGYLASLAVPGHTGDLIDLVRSPELAWSSTRLGTGGRLLLQYLAERDGPQVLGDLWRDARAGEQPLDTYRRLTGLSIEALHRRVAEYAMRTVTWDFAGTPGLGAALDQVDPLVLRERATPVDADPTTPGIYRVPGVFAPSDQGFTIVRMVPDTAGGTVRVRLRGHEDTASAAGWAYGFVAVGDGAARYTTVTESADAEIEFTLREREQEIYLVVVGAPAASHAYESRSGSGSTYRYPFEFAVSGASVEPADATVTVEGAHRHPNGGGWVDDRATVADTVYVAPGAVVRGAANLSGDVRVEGRAWVADGAVLTDRAVVRDAAVVGSAARLGGDVVVGGDAVVDLVCTQGSFLTYEPGRTCDGRTAADDVNAPVQPFAASDLAISVPVTAPQADEPTSAPSAPSATAEPGDDESLEEAGKPAGKPDGEAGATPAPPAVRDDGRPRDGATSGGVAPPDPVAAGCTASYTAKTWPEGFQGTIVVTAGPEGLQAWTLTWTLPDGQQITEAWGIMLGTSGSTVTGENTSWNGVVAPGGSITLGFNGSAKGSSGSVVPAVTCTKTR
ncbi:DUF6055 domain-containing protein [Cellulomonas soli]|uniref:DUF6055 domain-containing protein n=1 Tax=Cellulomonas soli TaxID=931535 RepID=UPI003F84EAD6